MNLIITLHSVKECVGKKCSQKILLLYSFLLFCKKISCYSLSLMSYIFIIFLSFIIAVILIYGFFLCFAQVFVHGHDFLPSFYGKNITTLNMAYEYIEHDKINKNNNFHIYLKKMTIYLLANDIPLKFVISCFNTIYIALHCDYIEDITFHKSYIVSVFTIMLNVHLIFFTNLMEKYSIFCYSLYVFTFINFTVSFKKIFWKNYCNGNLKLFKNDIAFLENTNFFVTCIFTCSIICYVIIMCIIDIYKNCTNKNYYNNEKECEKYITGLATIMNFFSNLLIILLNVIFFVQSMLKKEIHVANLIKTIVIIWFVIYFEYMVDYLSTFIMCIDIIICLITMQKYTKEEMIDKFYKGDEKFDVFLFASWLSNAKCIFGFFLILPNVRNEKIFIHFQKYFDLPLLFINLSIIYGFLHSIAGKYNYYNIKYINMDLKDTSLAIIGLLFNYCMMYAFYKILSYASIITFIIVTIFELNVIFCSIIPIFKKAKEEIQVVYNNLEGQYECIEHKKNEDDKIINNI